MRLREIKAWRASAARLPSVAILARPAGRPMSDFFVSKLEAREDPQTDWFERAPAAASAPWTSAEAFMAILFSAAASDGEFGVVEHEAFLALRHRSRALKHLDAKAAGAAMSTVLARLEAGGESALAAACAALPQQMRASAFAHALDLISCDGDMLRDEAEFLDALALALELEFDLVQHIASVILLKNKY
jgi:tellurite resistance protein